MAGGAGIAPWGPAREKLPDDGPPPMSIPRKKRSLSDGNLPPPKRLCKIEEPSDDGDDDNDRDSALILQSRKIKKPKKQIDDNLAQQGCIDADARQLDDFRWPPASEKVVCTGDGWILDLLEKEVRRGCVVIPTPLDISQHFLNALEDAVATAHQNEANPANFRTLVSLLESEECQKKMADFVAISKLNDISLLNEFAMNTILEMLSRYTKVQYILAIVKGYSLKSHSVYVPYRPRMVTRGTRAVWIYRAEILDKANRTLKSHWIPFVRNPTLERPVPQITQNVDPTHSINQNLRQPCISEEQQDPDANFTPGLARNVSEGTASSSSNLRHRGQTQYSYNDWGVRAAPPKESALPLKEMQGITSQEMLTFFPNHCLTWPAIVARIHADGWKTTHLCRYINRVWNLEEKGAGVNQTERQNPALIPNSQRNNLNAAYRSFYSNSGLDYSRDHGTDSRELLESIQWSGPVNQRGTGGPTGAWSLTEIANAFNGTPHTILCKGSFTTKILNIIQGQPPNNENLRPLNPPPLPNDWVPNSGVFWLDDSTISHNLYATPQNHTLKTRGQNIDITDLPQRLLENPLEIIRRREYNEYINGENFLWLISRNKGGLTLGDVADELTARDHGWSTQAYNDNRQEVRSTLSYRKKAALTERAKKQKLPFDAIRKKFATEEATPRRTRKSATALPASAQPASSDSPRVEDLAPLLQYNATQETTSQRAMSPHLEAQIAVYEEAPPGYMPATMSNTPLNGPYYVENTPTSSPKQQVVPEPEDQETTCEDVATANETAPTDDTALINDVVSTIDIAPTNEIATSLDYISEQPCPDNMTIPDQWINDQHDQTNFNLYQNSYFEEQWISGQHDPTQCDLYQESFFGQQWDDSKTLATTNAEASHSNQPTSDPFVNSEQLQPGSPGLNPYINDAGYFDLDNNFFFNETLNEAFLNDDIDAFATPNED